MGRIFPIIIFGMISICYLRCYSKAYPESRFDIDPKFSEIFYSIAKGDTFSLMNSKGKIKSFTITKVDSIISNTKGGFISERPYKSLRFYIDENGGDKTFLKRENYFSVGKDPVSLTNGITIQFNNFYYGDTILPALNIDKIQLNDKKIEACYEFKTSLQNVHPNDVELLYISPQSGIIAFKTLSGEIWLR